MKLLHLQHRANQSSQEKKKTYLKLKSCFHNINGIREKPCAHRRKSTSDVAYLLLTNIRWSRESHRNDGIATLVSVSRTTFN